LQAAKRLAESVAGEAAAQGIEVGDEIMQDTTDHCWIQSRSQLTEGRYIHKSLVSCAISMPPQ
jgi:hypothetical protein